MSSFYTVEKIIGRRTRGKGDQYLVKWVGFPRSQSTWEPALNLKPVQYMIDEYERRISQPVYKKKKMMKLLDMRDENFEGKDNENEESYNSDNDEEESVRKPGRPPKNKKLVKSVIHNKNESAFTGPEDEEMRPAEQFEDGNEISGSIECDVPHQVVSACITSDNKILLKVIWNERYDKTQPKASEVSSGDFKKKYPHLLLSYYESQIQ